MMKIYRVGGAVRDALLGLPVQDIDYVVTGSTPEQMIATGYTPVGNDFPVFLHPTSKAEYALARTERKSAPGYHGFVFHCDANVTLEQDLQRRDLTINAMAVADQDSSNQTIIDPFGGQRDLAAKVFRHVSDAFSEDPVRILRLARFAARFDQFSIAPETMQLMCSMVTSGEVDALVPERVWQEIARGLVEANPSRLLEVLHATGALKRIIPEFDQSYGLHMRQAVDFAAQQHQPLAVRWAALCTAIQPDSVLKIGDRLRIPADLRDMALLASREQQQIKGVGTLTADSIVNLLERCDALRRPARFIETLESVRCSCLLLPSYFPQLDLLRNALAAAQSTPNSEIARKVAQQFPHQPQQIAEHIFAARVVAVQKLLNIN
jgi:tRNA nucleotidyltransferase (CCA-adding enzyme)